MTAVRHIVLIRFKPETDEAVRAATVADCAAMLNTLVDTIPGLVSGVAGRDIGLSSGSMDAGLVLDTTDAEAWTAYYQHPIHQAFVADRLAPVMAERVAIQFPIPS
jgi:hypothetical protein